MAASGPSPCLDLCFCPWTPPLPTSGFSCDRAHVLLTATTVLTSFCGPVCPLLSLCLPPGVGPMPVTLLHIHPPPLFGPASAPGWSRCRPRAGAAVQAGGAVHGLPQAAGRHTAAHPRVLRAPLPGQGVRRGQHPGRAERAAARGAAAGRGLRGPAPGAHCGRRWWAGLQTAPWEARPPGLQGLGSFPKAMGMPCPREGLQARCWGAVLPGLMGEL